MRFAQFSARRVDGNPFMKQLIFVLEDETEICELAQWCLEEAGYAVRVFSTSNVIQEAEDYHPALMLITMMMPDGNGLDLCRQIRRNRALARTPIVFLIPESAEEHRALALESGADDCIVKPFSPRELVARVQAVLRRFTPADGRPHIEPADLVIDSLAMKLSVRGSEVSTTSLEFRLIEYLARHRGQVFTRDLLLDAFVPDLDRDDRSVAFKDIGPKAPLHELVIPIKHIASLAEATPADVELFGHLMVIAAQRARESGLAANGFRVVMNAGADAGQSVHHVHLHVLGGRAMAWPPG